MKEFAFAQPQFVDVVVPGTPGTLPTIMRSYPLSWERAGNGPYFAGTGQLVGLAAERGTVYKDYGDTAVTKKWPAFYIENGKAAFGPTDTARAKKAAAAFSAGPMLVEKGGVLDVAQRIRDGGYSGFNASDRKAQRAIGITSAGVVVDGIWEAATLYEVAEDMIAQGCVEVMKLDGGGSSGVVERKNGVPVLQAGWDERRLPAVIAFQRVQTQERIIKTSKVDLDLNFERNLTSNFKMREFACKHCGAVSVSPKFAEMVGKLQTLRDLVGRPINVTSGYRCAAHDYNVGTSSAKGRGPHTTGTAADIWWDGATVDQMAQAAKTAGFTGIGKYYALHFIHVDLRQPPLEFIG